MKTLWSAVLVLGLGCGNQRRPPETAREPDVRVEALVRQHRDDEMRIAGLEAINARLENEVADLKRTIRQGEVYIFLPDPAVPAIDARVIAVKLDVEPNLVLLSVGSDDKVEKGFNFSIYRGPDFVGKVVVEKVLHDSCGCRVLFTKDGMSICPGDLAATRLE